jgi:UPF0716 protein FxsA
MDIRRWFLLAVLSLPFLELYLLIKLFGALGFVLTLALLLGSAGLGMSLLRSQGLATWMRVQHALARGEVPAQEMLESGLVALGGLLLVVPGLISDILALFCLVPGSRRRIAQRLLERGYAAAPEAGGSGGRLTIDGEFKREE